MISKLPEVKKMTSKINPMFPAAYLVALPHRPLLVPPNKVFAYILAADGLYKVAESRHFSAIVPVATWPRLLPGLAYIAHGLIMPARLPVSLLDACVAHARRNIHTEVMYQFYIRGNRVHVTRPEQQATPGRVTYNAQDIDPAEIVLDLHSHHKMGTAFSGIDDRDEGGLRLYAVIGHLHRHPAEINLRVGVYGDFAQVPATAVFHGKINMRDRYHDAANSSR